MPPSVALVAGKRVAQDRVGAPLDRHDRADGPAGVGKSALAGTIATRLAPLFPGGQFYLDFYGSTSGLTPMTAEEAVGSLLRALGGAMTSGTPSAEAGELRARLSDRRVLVVLDNVVDTNQVRRLLSILSNATVIVTSRTALPTLDITHFAVRALGADDSVKLLARNAGSARISASPQHARELAAMCDYLPLALRIVGARLSTHPEWALADMVARLSDEQHRLDELCCDDLAVRASLAVTCDVLIERPGGPEAWSFQPLGQRVRSDARARTGPGADRSHHPHGAYAAGPARRRRTHRGLRPGPLPPARSCPDLRHGARPARPRGSGGCDTRDPLLLPRHRARRQGPDPAGVRPAADRFAEPHTAVTFSDQHGALQWPGDGRENLVAASRMAARDDTPAGTMFAARLCAELYPFLPCGVTTQTREVASARYGGPAHG